MESHSLIQYPRNRVVRAILRMVGRLLLAIFARINIIGRENLPRKGPAILAGNHVAIMEAVMMAVYPPVTVEFLGTGDIPIDPKFAWLANIYQFIPIKRGSIDRTGIKVAVDILKQGGVIGIFPQGGIWDAAAQQGRIGTALLSHLGNSPVIPIGFGGMKGALIDILKFKRPLLTMNVGASLPVIDLNNESSSRKAGLEAAADLIMKQILALLPEDERLEMNQRINEEFDVFITLRIPEGLIEDFHIFSSTNMKQELGKFFHYPILLDVLGRNLKLPISALQRLGEFVPIQDIQKASAAILEYLKDNPGFFTYRLGMESGILIQQALEELVRYQTPDRHHDGEIKFDPWYSYDHAITGNRVIVRGAQSLDLM